MMRYKVFEIALFDNFFINSAKLSCLITVNRVCLYFLTSLFSLLKYFQNFFNKSQPNKIKLCQQNLPKWEICLLIRCWKCCRVLSMFLIIT